MFDSYSMQASSSFSAVPSAEFEVPREHRLSKATEPLPYTAVSFLIAREIIHTVSLKSVIHDAMIELQFVICI